ncbi:DNA-binding protein [Bacillus cereus]|uniref:PadR family transcriptional regulator n=1 Tax=Bacillus mycoides TaxID=1405 RepID=UPI00077AD68A|nr:PadR family transcriptional regulator [Bacillus mycoides]KXY40033.1 DNA-binding protein [Bacillus cereus]QWG87702.1 PadR family transcriptional regulator [Bacillus mycoides]
MKNDKWVVQLRKGVFEVAILSLISKKPMYGYEITSCLKKSTTFQIPNGSIYPILNRITENNWAVSYWEESKDGPKRKYYFITNEGREILINRFEDYEVVYQELQKLKNGGGEINL